MRSYTSSSSLPAPAGPWAKTWALALALVALTLAGWETAWRARGFIASVENDTATWALARTRVRRDSIVLLGSSRIQTDVVPEVFAAEMGGRTPVQLAISGSSPLPVLEALAADDNFAGVVIVDLIPRDVFDRSRDRDTAARKHLEAFKQVRTSPAKLSESYLRTALQSRLVSLQPALSPARVLEAIRASRWPEPPIVQSRQDRYLRLDFSRVRLNEQYGEVYERAVAGRPASPAERVRIIERIEAAVARIHSRGGRVAFVHLPTSGVVRDAEEKWYPRRDYWDALAARTAALAVHSADHPGLRRFSCPDGHHLDAKDAPLFTAALARLLKSRGL